MDPILQFLTSFISGPGAYGDAKDSFKMYAPPNLLDVYTPEQQEAYGKQIQSQMRSPWSSQRPEFAQVQMGIVNAAKSRAEIEKAQREAAAEQGLQSDMSNIFGGNIPKPPVMGMTPEANAQRAAPAASNRKTQAQQYFLAAQAMALRGQSEGAKRYHDMGLALDPNPSEDIRSLEYLSGKPLAGTGQSGINLIKQFNESRANKNNINVNSGIQKGEEAYWGALGKQLPELESAAMAASRTNDALQSMVDLGNKKTFTGSLAPGAIGATQFLNSFGLNVKPETLANTREYQAQANILVLDFMGAMGGARGFSKEESQILYDAFPKIIDSPQARERIARMLMSRNNRLINDYNTMRNQFEQGIGKPLASPRIKPFEFGNSATGGEGSAKPTMRFDPETKRLVPVVQ